MRNVRVRASRGVLVATLVRVRAVARSVVAGLRQVRVDLGRVLLLQGGCEGWVGREKRCLSETYARRI